MSSKSDRMRTIDRGLSADARLMGNLDVTCLAGRPSARRAVRLLPSSPTPAGARAARVSDLRELADYWRTGYDWRGRRAP